MKKAVSIISVILMIMLFSTTAFAHDSTQNTPEVSTNSFTEYFSDGSYTITTIRESNGDRNGGHLLASQSKFGSKEVSFYDTDGVKQWTVTIEGTFSYNGSSAICVSATASYFVYGNSWKVTSAVASKAGSTAIGDFVVKQYTLGIPFQTEKPTVKLYCSASGVLS